MKQKGKHTNTQFPAALKILLVSALVLVLCAALLFGVFFIAARGPWPAFSQKLCATLAEKNSVFGGVFFTTNELQKAKFYYAGQELEGNLNPGRSYENCDGGIELSADGWKGYIISVPSSAILLGTDEKASGREVTLGLTSDPSAVFADGCLTYKGESELERYTFAGIDSSGILHASSMTPVEAVNAGYIWGFSAERVLINGGAPCADLGGGYAARAAIGQREDGTYLIFAAESKGFYPCGISYEDMASVMYKYGAVRAVALTPAGEMCVNGKSAVSFDSKAGYVLYTSTMVN